ncbi:hypothetical protein T484DRAFT_1831533 [Baffinella frigidus]|nr:hypothetical protein T484DRAFT_1831533 [Cryptophyta sp. CCMP2293]
MRDAYEEALGRPVPLTTKTKSFADAIDWIFLSPRLVPIAVLELPYELDATEDMEMIPSATFPSDHLALAADLSLTPQGSAAPYR